MAAILEREQKKTDYHRNMICEICGRATTSKNYQRHMRSCSVKNVDYRVMCPVSTEYEFVDTDPLYHVMLRTDNLLVPLDKILDCFEIYNNIYAECGSHGKKEKLADLEDMKSSIPTTSHPHVHFIGKWICRDQKKSRILSLFFKDKRSFQCKKITEYLPGTENVDVRNTHARLLKCIWYIQTVKGDHPKTNHKNSLVFTTKYKKNEFIKNLSARHIWLVESYAKYLLKHKKRFEDQEEHNRRVDSGEYLREKININFVQQKKVLGKLDYLVAQHPLLYTADDSFLHQSYLSYLDSIKALNLDVPVKY